MQPAASAGPSVEAARLAFGFAGCRAAVRLGDPAQRASLVESLSRCIAQGEAADPPVATFEVGGSATIGYSLARDGETLVEGLGAFDLRERLLYELTLALARGVRERPVFHAAGLAWGDRGVVLSGASGAGKSTLATRLLALGGALLSDELVAVSPTGGLMVGFPRPVVLKDGGIALGASWLAERLGATPPPDPDGAVRLRPEWPDGLETRARLVVFPRFAPGAETTLRPLSRAGAIYRLLPGLMNAAGFADRGLRAVGNALEGAVAYGLEYGDGESAAREVRRLVDNA